VRQWLEFLFGCGIALTAYWVGLFVGEIKAMNSRRAAPNLTNAQCSAVAPTAGDMIRTQREPPAAPTPESTQVTLHEGRKP
jgi:hypothetical protein